MEDFSLTDSVSLEIEELARGQMASPRNSPPLPAVFEVEAVLDEQATKEKGRPVYRDQEIITIRVGTGDTRQRIVTDDDRRTYAAQYVAWKKRHANPGAVEGFPLEQWAMIPGKAVVRQFADHGIRTVEQLAAMSDSRIEEVGPYKTLRKHAQDWVDNANKTAPIAKLRESLAAAEAQIKELESRLTTAMGELSAARSSGGVLPPAPAGPDPRIAALEAQMAALVAAVQTKPTAEVAYGTPKRRGRPPKAKPPEPGPEA
jgi:hypothetical protein